MRYKDCHMKLTQFRRGDRIICIVNNHKYLAPCEVNTVTAVVDDYVQLEGYLDKKFYRHNFRLYERH